ncbi:MAG: aryldialkylphosphatase [Chloroflexota bacterium]|nr:aryldialkylphosphatase [Chloroflexota bacterium]
MHVREGVVVTVKGPLPASALGVTDSHDHLFLRSPALRGQEFDDLASAVAEVREAQATGLQAIVEMTPIGCGRRPDLMRAVSEATGMPLIAATGYHRDAHYPDGHWVHEASVEMLAGRIISDLHDGMHPADWLDPSLPLDPARAGVIKAGASYQRISDSERRRLEAAAIGHRRTGAAILVHAEVGTCGHEIVDLLTAQGVPSGSILLAHMDRNPDPELHAEIAARGVTLEYDTIGRIKYRPDSALLDLIESVVAAGQLERIVLGLDLGRRDYFQAYGGGPGMRTLMETFVPRLRRRIGEAAVETIMVANPARAFALAEVSEAAVASAEPGA